MRARFLRLILWLLIPVGALAQNGNILSATLENNLTAQGFLCAREPLASTSQDAFPYNIELSFAAAPQPDAPQNASAESGRNTIIFAFAQEDARDHSDALTDFLTRLKNTPLSANVTVLLAAQESSPANQMLSGTGVFAQNFDDTDQAAAIAVSFGDAHTTAVLTGSVGTMTPLWLTRQIIAACTREGIAYTYPHRFAALYRMGLLRGDRREAAFIRNGIPAAAVVFASPDDLRLLLSFAVHFTQDGTEWWDNHYIFVPLPPPLKPLWIGEPFFFLFCLILGTLSLLILCTVSFVGKNGEDYKQDFKRSWYLIPLTLAITYGSFLLGQKVCMTVPLLARATPIVQCGIALIFALLFISVLFALQEYFKISSIQFTHGYFIYLLGISNIFIFSAVDISFFLVFLLEYFFIYIARKANRIIPLVISVLLMLTPFIPYLYSLIRDAYLADIRRFLFSSPLYTLLMALLTAPFLIMWLRMLVRLEIYAATNNFSLKNMLFHGSVSTGAIIAVTIVFVVALSVFAPRLMRHPAASPVQTVNENRYTFEITATKDDFQGMTTRHISVISKEPAVHYDITLSSESSVPLFDATYDYTVNEETKSATFTVPDYPPQTITIDYAADENDDATFFVTAWYATSQEHVYRKESHAYIVEGAA